MKQLVRIRVDCTIELETETPHNLPQALCGVSMSAALVAGLILEQVLPDPTTLVHGYREVSVVDRVQKEKFL